MQLICTMKTDDAAALAAALANDLEDQSNAGLTMLQIWRDVDDPSTLLALFEVNDRGRAEGWLQRAVADTHGRRAGVTASEHRFVHTT